MTIPQRVLEAGSNEISVYPLQQILIAWDFHSDIVSDRTSNVDHERILLQRALASPIDRPNRAKDAWRPALEPLAVSYVSPDDYVNHMLPVMLLECKQGIHRAREMDMNDQSGECVVLIGAAPKEDAFQIVVSRQGAGNGVRYGQGDLALLYLEAPDGDCEHLTASFKKRIQAALQVGLESEGDEDLVRDEAVVMEGGGRTDKGTCQTVIEEEDMQDKGKAAYDSEGRAVRAPSPLVDNPHHVLAIVEASESDRVTLRVLIRDSDVTADNLLGVGVGGSGELATPLGSQDGDDGSSTAANSEAADGSGSGADRALRRKMLVEFMMERERYRMREVTNQIIARRQHWFLAKVMNLVTIYREYQALMSFSDLSLMPHLLLSDPALRPNSARARRRRKRGVAELDRLEIPEELHETLLSMYNASQMASLQECLKTEGITCIQGPPGTGKTTTIMGILSVILNATARQKEAALLGQGRIRRRVPGQIQDAAVQQQLQAATPWLHEPGYRPWYDTQEVSLEDLEDPTPIPNAIQQHAFVDLVRMKDSVSPKRILVCAPSNAAIDEIMRRLTADPRRGGGVFDGTGSRYNPQVLRVGPNCHPDLMPWTLQARLAGRMQASANTNPQSEEIIKLALLEEAKVVCATLSMTGSKELTTFPGGFDTVVVDEASQGVELSTLIPLKLNCRRLVLVGDPRQLPATVFSKVALDLKYDQSLFQRLERGGHKINLLSVQYRMHPEISSFPSRAFYEGQLLDWEGVEAAAKPPINYYSIPPFRPVVFFSIASEEAALNASRVNHSEIDFICDMLLTLKTLFQYVPHYKDVWMSRIAVISPYAEQVRNLIARIKAVLGGGDHCPVDVNTVDGAQGREKDLVIFSAVRAQCVSAGAPGRRKTDVGFLADRRRMNVALTRARLNMWVVGNGPYLSGNPEWGAFWQDAQERQYTFNVNYTTYGRECYMKQWLVDYFHRNKAARALMESEVPEFVRQIDEEVKLLRSVGNELAKEQVKAAREAELNNQAKILATQRAVAAQV